jgi:hypothetical protein
MIVIMAIAPSALHAQSINFTASFPKIYEEWIRDEAKHTNRMTINGFIAQVEYGMRVTNADTGEVIASGATVPEGTRLKLEFLDEKLSYTTTGRVTDTPYGLGLDGSIDDVRIYNRTLTPGEVKQLYNLGAATIRP